VGPGLQCPSLNPLKSVKFSQTLLNLNFELFQTLTDSKGFFLSLIFLIKYGCEGVEERNRFLHSNFFRFGMYFK
jgi:hypothetical protein